MIKFAIIGADTYSSSIPLETLKGPLEGGELVALIGQNSTKLNELGDKYQVKYRLQYKEARPFLDSCNLNTLLIATSSNEALEIAKTYHEKGVHLLGDCAPCTQFLEISPNLEPKLSKLNDLHIVNFSLFSPGFLDAKKNIQEGKIGEIKMINLHHFLPLNEIYFSELMINPLLYTLGPYSISLLRNLIDAPPESFVASSNLGFSHHSRIVDQTLCCTLKYPGEKMANLILSNNPYSSSALEIIGTKGKVRLEKVFSPWRSMNLKFFQNNKIMSKRYSPLNIFERIISLTHNDSELNHQVSSNTMSELLIDFQTINGLQLSLDLNSPVRQKELSKKNFYIPPLTQVHPIEKKKSFFKQIFAR
jgi:predicted dehydrogenase